MEEHSGGGKEAFKDPESEELNICQYINYMRTAGVGISAEWRYFVLVKKC